FPDRVASVATEQLTQFCVRPVAPSVDVGLTFLADAPAPGAFTLNLAIGASSAAIPNPAANLSSGAEPLDGMTSPSPSRMGPSPFGGPNSVSNFFQRSIAESRSP